MRVRAIFLVLALAGTAAGVPAQDVPQETIVAGLSQSRIAITANFDGSQIIVYGAVKRDAPPPAGPLGVIVTVEGPSGKLVVRRKDRVWGIWINDASVTIDSAPSFYEVATNAPIDEILSGTEDLRHKITVPRAIRAVGATSESEDAAAFSDALLRIRKEDGTYRLATDAVDLSEETLFRADVDLPANLTEGDYRVRMFLTRGGRIVDWQEQLIDVRKAGLERFLFNLSQQQPLVYGVLALALAAFAGWAASEAFRRFRA